MDQARLIDQCAFKYVLPEALRSTDYTTAQVMVEFEAFAARQTHYRNGKPGYVLALVAADRSLFRLEHAFETVDQYSNGQGFIGIPEAVASKLLLAAGKRGGAQIDYLALKGEDKDSMRHWFYVFKQRYGAVAEAAGLRIKNGSSHMRISPGEGEPRFTIKLSQSDPSELFLQLLASYAQSSVESRLKFLQRKGLTNYFSSLDESHRFQAYLPTTLWFLQHPAQVLDLKTPPYFRALSDCFVKTLLKEAFDEFPDYFEGRDLDTLKKILKARHKRAFRKAGFDRSSSRVQLVMTDRWNLLETRLDSLLGKDSPSGATSMDIIRDRLGYASETDINLVYTALEMPQAQVDLITRDQDVKDGVILANTFLSSLGEITTSSDAELSASASADDLDALLVADERRAELHGYFMHRHHMHKAMRWTDPYSDSRRRPRPRR
ncbi:MAG TPA: hypothetical protein VJH22_06650 [Candidatus Nanoarchaeia archaeon]|nr:hypothetical protein [Candidatus Nanoarchaeia archaeon]